MKEIKAMIRCDCQEEKVSVMVQTLLKEFVAVKHHVTTWEEAIKVAATPLLDAGYIEERYIHQMIVNVKELGPYIVVMPNVALPHARSEHGAIKTGISIMKLNEKVSFPSNQDVQLLVVLSAQDNDAHMQLLSELVDIFMDDEKMSKIFDATCERELLEVL